MAWQHSATFENPLLHPSNLPTPFTTLTPPNYTPYLAPHSKPPSHPLLTPLIRSRLALTRNRTFPSTNHPKRHSATQQAILRPSTHCKPHPSPSGNSTQLATPAPRAIPPHARKPLRATPHVQNPSRKPHTCTVPTSQPLSTSKPGTCNRSHSTIPHVQPLTKLPQPHPLQTTPPHLASKLAPPAILLISAHLRVLGVQLLRAAPSCHLPQQLRVVIERRLEQRLGVIFRNRETHDVTTPRPQQLLRFRRTNKLHRRQALPRSAPANVALVQHFRRRLQQHLPGIFPFAGLGLEPRGTHVGTVRGGTVRRGISVNGFVLMLLRCTKRCVRWGDAVGGGGCIQIEYVGTGKGSLPAGKGGM